MVNYMIYDYVVLGSRRFRDKANKIGQQIMDKGFKVKLISESAPRIETDGVDVLRKLKTQYQKQHFEAIRWCKRGVILCNFNGYIGLNTKAELIFVNAYDIPILSIEKVNSQEEEIKIMNIQRLDFSRLWVDIQEANVRVSTQTNLNTINYRNVGVFPSFHREYISVKEYSIRRNTFQILHAIIFAKGAFNGK